jgi:GTP-binding protein
MSDPFQQTVFRLGAGRLSQMPADTGREIAFAGRSNAGKSSALNALCSRQALARVSRTPGRTQEINVFDLPGDHERRLIDLPGLGYARVAATQRERWTRLLEAYFRQRQSLSGVVMVMDIRHPLTPVDRSLLDLLLHADVPRHVLLTKADKLSRNEALKQLSTVHRILEAEGVEASLQTFSSLKRDGVKDLQGLLLEWLGE